MTRWHEDDLVGRLLNPEYGEVEDWEIINLPAVAEEGDVLGREPGEALWPERYDLAELKRIKKRWALLVERFISTATKSARRFNYKA